MDTITALATPPGVGGIAVVRISGDEAFEIADKIFVGKKKISEAKGGTLLRGKVYKNGVLIDDAVAAIFRAPKSYTGENVVEISCHGGKIASSLVIEALLENGARIAEPGEFTQRAFVNGKMDLAQVEAVADLIHSESIKGAQISARQLIGEFSARLNEIREKALNAAALLELELDFAEEEIELTNPREIEELLSEALKYCEDLSESYKSAEILRSGFFVGIAGRPNSGKSTLFNALLRRKRAIVSSIPGTTRDYLEESLSLGGVSVRLIDTAGLRKAEDEIEIEGVKLVESVLRQSNLILIVNDIIQGTDRSDKLRDELKRDYPEAKIVLAQNKIDKIENFSRRENELYISAKTGEGLDELRSLLEKEASESSESAKDVLLNQRQSALLKNAAKEFESAIRDLKFGRGNEIIAASVRRAAGFLGEITGKTWSQETLNKIFSRFCIGK